MPDTLLGVDFWHCFWYDLFMRNTRETLDKRNKLKREWKEKTPEDSVPKFVVKKCKDCGEEKECQWQHSFTQTGRPEYRARCCECHKKYLKGVRKKARLTLTRQKRERTRRNKQDCIDYLGGECRSCGYKKSTYALTFHHRDKSEKEGVVAVMIQNLSFKNQKLKRELDKCDLLCFNCHMELHGDDDV